MSKKDDFYEITADTYNVQRGVYSREDLSTLSIQSRLDRHCSGVVFTSADDVASYFKIEIPEDRAYENLDQWDYIFALVAGAACALSAVLLKEPLSKLHDADYRKQDNPTMFKIQKWLEHKGHWNDKVQGLGHRVKYGHDAFNFKEISECIADQKHRLVQAGGGGAKLYSLRAVIDILKHVLIADPMSKEGLPIPGHTLFRDRLYEFSKHNNDLYKKLFTIKTGDAIGLGVLTLMCRLYKTQRGVTNDQYRYYNINLVANASAIVFQLLLNRTLNLPCLAKMFLDNFRVCYLSEKIRKGIITDEKDSMLELKCLMKDEYHLSEFEIIQLTGE